MIKIKEVAIKTHDGKIHRGKPGQHHDDLKVEGQHGFITSTGEFVGRRKAARFAFLSGQTVKLHNKLHSHDLWK